MFHTKKFYKVPGQSECFETALMPADSEFQINNTVKYLPNKLLIIFHLGVSVKVHI